MISDLWRRLAKATVRLYPAAWRARYEDEVVSLLDATAPGPGVVADMLRGAVRVRSGVAESVLAFLMIFVRAFVFTWVATIAVGLVVVAIAGARHVSEIPYWGVPTYLWIFSTAVSMPAWLLLRASGTGRRFPRMSRVLYVSAFMWFSIWLLHLHIIELPIAFAGWLIAVRLFPLPTSKPVRPVITISTIGNVARLLGVLIWAYLRASVIVVAVLLVARLVHFEFLPPVMVLVDPGLYVFSLFFGMPMLTIVIATGIGARFPIVSRWMFLAAFLGLSAVWGDVAGFLQMLLVGSMLAARLLPRSSSETSPPATVANTPSTAAATDYDAADRRLRMVLTS